MHFKNIFLSNSKDYSNWGYIRLADTTGIPCGSILQLVLFNDFTDDLDAELECILSKLADNMKLGGAVDCLENREALQRDTEKSEGWVITS